VIAYFISNTCAKYYENPTMLSRVTAKNVRDVFLRHTVYQSKDHYYETMYSEEHQTPTVTGCWWWWCH